MSISSKIETHPESTESSATPNGDLNATNSSGVENPPKAEEAGEFEEFTLDDIEVIESKVFA